MALDKINFNLFGNNNYQVQGIKGVNAGKSQATGGSTSFAGNAGSSNLVDRLNALDNKLEGGQNVSNGYSGVVNGKSNNVANKLNLIG